MPATVRRPLLLVALGVALVLWLVRALDSPGHDETPPSPPLDSLAPAQVTSELPEPTPAPPTWTHACQVDGDRVYVKRDLPYRRKHVRAAQGLQGTQLVTDEAVLSDLLRSGTFVELDHGPGYMLGHEHMTHSKPVLHAWAAETLQELGRAYAKRLEGTAWEGSMLLITSMTRTAAQQGDLDDAGKSPLSAHSFGGAFDVGGVRATGEGGCSFLRRAVGKTLMELRSEGRVRLLPERDCIHVTVVPEPAEAEASASPAATEG